MIIITTLADIEAHLSSVRPGINGQGLTGGLRDAVQVLPHPDFGTDWSEWLALHTDELLAIALRAAAESTVNLELARVPDDVYTRAAQQALSAGRPESAAHYLRQYYLERAALMVACVDALVRVLP